MLLLGYVPLGTLDTTYCVLLVLLNGRTGGDRTHDQGIMSALLLPLSYSPLAEGLGLEPRTRASKARVLPLHHPSLDYLCAVWPSSSVVLMVLPGSSKAQSKVLVDSILV